MKFQEPFFLVQRKKKERKLIENVIGKFETGIGFTFDMIQTGRLCCANILPDQDSRKCVTISWKNRSTQEKKIKPECTRSFYLRHTI